MSHTVQIDFRRNLKSVLCMWVAGVETALKCLVAGVAGFIGSNLAEELVRKGHEVFGVDCFTDYYPRKLKEANLATLGSTENFTFIEGNLLDVDLYEGLPGIECVFHLAAQPGVRGAWGSGFRPYVENNVMATQVLLEAAKSMSLSKFVYASSSSIYGEAETYPTPEAAIPRPTSPYGATKLAGETLCYAYHKNFGIPIIILRYFSVYGPRQRPEMAFARFIRAMTLKQTISVFGDGTQTRDFTFVDDIVHATILAAESEHTLEVFNVGGGSRTTLMDAIRFLQTQIDSSSQIVFLPTQKGDVHDTCADISKARDMLGYAPCVGLQQGLASEVKYFQSHPSDAAREDRTQNSTSHRIR